MSRGMYGGRIEGLGERSASMTVPMQFQFMEVSDDMQKPMMLTGFYYLHF